MLTPPYHGMAMDTNERGEAKEKVDENMHSNEANSHGNKEEDGSDRASTIALYFFI